MGIAAIVAAAPLLLFAAIAFDRWRSGPDWNLGSRRKSAWLDGKMGDGDVTTLDLNDSPKDPGKRE